ncbi:biotin-protein ligase [Dunaliella salina]|uniref:Biotin-protein ligase n=1 Tax=Dunaliella salina TaxID=3046 RepID=A0ABQ7FWG1_DUNSA|nr:biotin-protein ligase [Dunaliella salina]|eukprot:KAF5826687.1 biotin-protein ligase [Dunaliella salina]
MRLIGNLMRPAAANAMPCCRQPAVQTTHKKRVCVYHGPGAGMRSALSAQESLKRELREEVEVCFLSSTELLSGSISPRTCALLVFPGGADLPYCRELNGKGNQIIRDYVSRGGSYLGLCAGAYYACSRVEFEAGDPVLEVLGERELGFFPGTAVGSAYKGFDYTSEAGAKAAPVRFISSYHHQQGNMLRAADQEGMHDAQEYAAEAAPWLLSPLFFKAEDGSGARANNISSSDGCCGNGSIRGSEHSNDSSKLNVIPMVSHLASCSHVGSRNSDGEELERPCLHTDAHASCQDSATQSNGAMAGSSVRGVGDVPLPSGWSRCLDYCNGGCIFRASSQSPRPPSESHAQHGSPSELHVQHSQQGFGGLGSSSSSSRGADNHNDRPFSVLALYEDMHQPAAVRCQVGAGVAVLCGTHPELQPHWLERAAAGAPALPNSEPGPTPIAGSPAPMPGSPAPCIDSKLETARAAPLAQHTSDLIAALRESEQSRLAFWRLLLNACCVSFCA